MSKVIVFVTKISLNYQLCKTLPFVTDWLYGQWQQNGYKMKELNDMSFYFFFFNWMRIIFRGMFKKKGDEQGAHIYWSGETNFTNYYFKKSVS